MFVPPEKRRIGLVFQDGALFPHMSVSGNIMYGRALTPEADRRVAATEAASRGWIGPMGRSECNATLIPWRRAEPTRTI